MAELTLTEPLEILIVDDARVSHSVTGALGAGETSGYRTSLLIDFTGIGLIKTADPTGEVGDFGARPKSDRPGLFR